jgi:G:T/U-mismatch repair DNA glycosylase
MNDYRIEIHPLQPFLPSNAILLLLGSFPPPRSKWRMDFFYPNFQNDMWRIMGVAFFNDKDHFLTEDKKSFNKKRIICFLEEKGIAIFDMAHKVIRHKENASDRDLEVVAPIDIRSVLLLIPSCRFLAATGEKAMDTLLSQFPSVEKRPSIGNFIEIPIDEQLYRLYRMPSSSRAYPKSLEEKASFYAKMFHDAGLL